MEITRYNPFNQIHKALRALSYDTAIALQQADFTLEAEMNTVLQRVALLVELYENHAYHEDYFMFPHLKKLNAGLAEEFDKEHHKDHELGERIKEAIAAWHSAADSDGRIKAGWSAYYALNEFIAFNLYHTNKEEREINPVIWKHFTDEELLALSHQIVATIPPDKMAIQGKWMVKGMNDEEISHWAAAIRQSAPDFVFQQIVELITNELTAERSRKILNAVLAVPAGKQA
jgi:hypothetical protein